ncbi:MAG: sulfatase [Clostridiaceae bacterium]|nr:sulfatase [Clostridiaceae bacterium]
MKKPNLLFFGIDSLRADHMSLYGYSRLTTPNIDRYLNDGGIVFDHCFSPSIPTTPGYSSMLTGMDCFNTNVVALRHEGKIADGVKSLAEVLREKDYNTTCIGFTGNPAAQGFDRYLDYEGWNASPDGRAHKAENLNVVASSEMERLAGEDKPFFLFLRHMDPHSPYLPPEPFHKMFYQKNELDPNNHSLEPVYAFKPFCDYFYSWFPDGCTDKDYIIAQYDAEIAYMDNCIQTLLEKLDTLGLKENTIVVFTSDHGETLYDHDCYFDHHGMYECTLTVPFAIRYEGKTKSMRMTDICQVKDVMPTLLDMMGIKTKIRFDGRNLMKQVRGEPLAQESEMYITECTWMRKHGWRTPQWKLMVALEPDFHYKPEVELYDLLNDPQELHNVAEENPETVAYLRERMLAHIAGRTAATGRENPMDTNLNWHGMGCGPFKTSDQAYNTMHIGDPAAARRLQAKGK